MREKGESPFDDVADSSDENEEQQAQDTDTETTNSKGTGRDADTSPDTSTSGGTTSTTRSRSSQNSSTDQDRDSGSESRSATTETEDDVPETVSESSSAFPYSDVTQRPIYAREDSWDRVEDLKYYSDGVLREQFGVRNAETREFDEAIAQLLVEELSEEDIAAKIVELRGFEP